MDARKNRTADMSMYQLEQAEGQQPEDELVQNSQTNETLALLQQTPVINRKKRRWS